MRKQTLTLFSSLAVISLLLAACGTPSTPLPSDERLKGNITVSGAFALYPMVTRRAEEFQKVHPEVTFDISAGGAGKGMTDALSGAVDLGMVSRAVSEEEEAQGAYAVAVVKDAVFPVVNVNNPVIEDIKTKGITQETFVKIFITGEITTWGEVVGKPEVTEEIHAYTRSDSAGAAEMWAKFLGDKKQEDLLGEGAHRVLTPACSKQCAKTRTGSVTTTLATSSSWRAASLWMESSPRRLTSISTASPIPMRSSPPSLKPWR